MSGLVDIHHHAFPPAYLDELAEVIASEYADFPHVLEWTPERSLEQLNANGYDRAILSISAPGVWFGDDRQAARLARLCNDYLADLTRAHPDRFGFFATVALPDAQASIDEIARCYDELGADGVCLMSSYGGRYLGDAAFDAVYAELERRQAVVFVHPVVSPACVGMLGDLVPDQIAEFSFDTTRTIMSLLFSGVLSRYPAVRFVFPHGGGAMPMLLTRLIGFPRFRPAAAAAAPEGIAEALGRQFFDVASVGHPATFAALRQFPGIDQLVHATDYPFRPTPLSASYLERAGATSDEQRRIERDNPMRLLSAEVGA